MEANHALCDTSITFVTGLFLNGTPVEFHAYFRRLSFPKHGSENSQIVACHNSCGNIFVNCVKHKIHVMSIYFSTLLNQGPGDMNIDSPNSNNRQAHIILSVCIDTFLTALMPYFCNDKCHPLRD